MSLFSLLEAAWVPASKSRQHVDTCQVVELIALVSGSCIASLALTVFKNIHSFFQVVQTHRFQNRSGCGAFLPCRPALSGFTRTRYTHDHHALRVAVHVHRHQQYAVNVSVRHSQLSLRGMLEGST